MEEYTKPKKKSHQQVATKNTELINVRFYENQKRQALTTTEEDEDVEESTDDFLLSSVETITQHVCDTVDDSTLKKIPSPPPSSGEAVDSTSTSSSLAISAPSDKSRKGSVDKKIWNLVNLINRETDSFFTTSSCSGRIILYTWDVTDGREAHVSTSTSSKLKKGCKWLLVSHDEVRPEELVNSYLATAVTSESSNQKDGNIPRGERDVYFKMEPCILHVQCRTLTNARKLIHIATESGFRNSGMVIGKENRITVAIRSAMGLEVPLPPASASSRQDESLQVNEEYLKYLVDTANAKMEENWSRSEKLTTLFAETSWKT